MATKPTTRIPLWASSGTKSDPGTGKEATGWVTSERPPAGWLNWILHTIGEWLDYFEDKTDETINPIVVFRIQTGGAGTHEVKWSSPSISPTWTYPGNAVSLQFSSALFANTTDYVLVAHGHKDTLSVDADVSATDTIVISARDNDTGTAIDLETSSELISVVAYGA